MTIIKQVNCLEQHTADNKRYAIYVLRKRAIANVKDGLKLVHKRSIYTAYHYKHADVNAVKSASVVGSVMEHLHPHGDVGIYESIKVMANWFDIKNPLFEGSESNWGTIQGHPQAHMRYTEAKLSQFTIDCILADLKEDIHTVDWSDDYLRTGKEPDFLPVRVPLLLLNGTFGIAFGLQTYVPPHNLGDVIDATINVALNPNTPVVLIPDLCQRCEIIDTNWKEISNKGKGKFKARGIVEIKTIDKSDEIDKHLGYPCVIIRSTPDLVKLNSIKDNLTEMINDKKLPQILNMYDKTVDEIAFYIVLKKGSDPNYIKDVLYNQAGLQKTYTVNLEVIDNNVDNMSPIRLSYKAYIQYFLELSKDVKFRLYSNKYQKVRTRQVAIEPYIKLVQSKDFDIIMNEIRKQETVDDNYLIEFIISKLSITRMQASFIINNQIKKLSKGYLLQFIDEYNTLEQERLGYLDKLSNDELLIQEIIEQLKNIKKKYNQSRKCILISEDEINKIPQGEFKLVITENNYIKKIGINDPIGYLKEDVVKTTLKVDNTKDILIFDEKGKAFKLPVHKIPISDRNSNGIDIRKLVKKLTSNINSVIYLDTIEELSKKTRKYFIVVLTQNGFIKKLDLDDFLTVTNSGLQFIKLEEGDIVKSISIVEGTLDIVVYSKNKALRMNMSEVPHQRRMTKGLRSITEGMLDGLSIIKPDTTSIVVLTEKGYINKFASVALPNVVRTKSETGVIKLTKGDTIKSILTVNENDTLIINTKNNKIELKVNELENGSSISSGNKMINTKNDIILKAYIVHNK